MTSNITPNTIIVNFPIAGQDNSSQGFRDNYQAIKTNLETAKSEIGDLQTNTAKTNQNNNFQNNELSGAVFIGNKVKIFNGGIIANSQNINLSNGHYQKFTASAIITLTFSEWSNLDELMDVVFIEIKANNTTQKTVTFATVQGGTIKVQSGITNPITLNDPSNPNLYKFWSYDGGLTVYMQSVGKFE